MHTPMRSRQVKVSELENLLTEALAEARVAKQQLEEANARADELSARQARYAAQILT